LTIRVTLEMREAVLAEADRTGWSMSQVAEQWMRDGWRMELILREVLRKEGPHAASQRVGPSR
jgi:hypothetical protein